jgi:hypothetical protein
MNPASSVYPGRWINPASQLWLVASSAGCKPLGASLHFRLRLQPSVFCITGFARMAVSIRVPNFNVQTSLTSNAQSPRTHPTSVKAKAPRTHPTVTTCHSTRFRSSIDVLRAGHFVLGFVVSLGCATECASALFGSLAAAPPTLAMLRTCPCILAQLYVTGRAVIGVGSGAGKTLSVW